MHAHAYIHAHMLNKSDNLCECVEKANRSTKKQTKNEEESKNAYEKFRGDFLILKFQANLGKKSKNKIGKVSRKNPDLFRFYFLEKFLMNFTYLLHHYIEFYHTTTAGARVPVFFCPQRPKPYSRLCSVCVFRNDYIRRDARYRHVSLCFPTQP